MKLTQTWLLIAGIVIAISGCVPERLKEEVDTAMKDAQEMLADEQFKNAISHIELHRLRFGNYPRTLSEIRFLTAMDSSMMNAVQYAKLDTGYELNLRTRYASIRGDSTSIIQLDYPDEFWQGLGCRKSNLKNSTDF